MNSKRKGNAGELELLHLLEAQGILCTRNDQRYCGGLENPDIAADLGGWKLHLEVKRTEHLRLYEALQQAIRDANGKRIPVVISRGNREEWTASMRLEDFIKIARGIQMPF